MSHINRAIYKPYLHLDARPSARRHLIYKHGCGDDKKQVVAAREIQMRRRNLGQLTNVNDQPLPGIVLYGVPVIVEWLARRTINQGVED